jgi:hypothetical protein
VTELQIFAFIVLPVAVVAIAGGMLILSRRAHTPAPPGGDPVVSQLDDDLRFGSDPRAAIRKGEA